MQEIEHGDGLSSQISNEGLLAEMAAGRVHLIRLMAEPLGEDAAREQLSTLISVEPEGDEFHSMRFNAYMLVVMTEEERAIALAGVDQELREALLTAMEDAQKRLALWRQQNAQQLDALSEATAPFRAQLEEAITPKKKRGVSVIGRLAETIFHWRR